MVELPTEEEPLLPGLGETEDKDIKTTPSVSNLGTIVIIAARKVLKLFVFISILLILLIFANQYRTTYSIDTDKAGDRFVYQHEDPRTTNIINYLTGRGKLPERERIPLYRQYLKNVLEEAKLEVPQDIYTMDKAELDRLAIAWYVKKFPRNPKDPEALQRIIGRLFENAVRPPLKEFGPEVDNKIWHLMVGVGAPKVRWIEEQDEYASQLVVYSADDNLSFYDPIDNTIYITYKNSVDMLLDEATHAKQFRTDPIRSYARLTYSMVDSFVRAGFDHKEARDLYQEKYKNPDSFEGEAHGRIKQELLREFDLKTVESKVSPKN